LNVFVKPRQVDQNLTKNAKMIVSFLVVLVSQICFLLLGQTLLKGYLVSGSAVAADATPFVRLAFAGTFSASCTLFELIIFEIGGVWDAR
jgi:uncharacterized membrane protein YjjP (DUF1212 family)